MLRVHIIYYLLSFCTLTIIARKSGLYFDNGIDTSIIEDIEYNDIVDVEEDLMDLFELPVRPKRLPLENILEKSSTQFLVNLYYKIKSFRSVKKNRPKRSPNDEFLLTSIDEQIIADSDHIMSFINKDYSPGDCQEPGIRLFFNLKNKVPLHNRILRGELRLFQNSQDMKNFKTNDQFSIATYAVKNIYGQQEMSEISVINTTAGYYGWLQINVTIVMDEWIQYPLENLGLYISAYPAGKPELHINIKHIGIGLGNERHDAEHQPFLIGFFFNGETFKPRKYSRLRRYTAKKSKSWENELEAINQRKSRSCQLYNFYISFRDLTWIDWIIAPEGISLPYCGGECKFPLHGTPATNHAIIQTLAHIKHPHIVPKAICGPTQLSPITILYNIDGYTNIKTFKDMIAEECGCH